MHQYLIGAALGAFAVIGVGTTMSSSTAGEVGPQPPHVVNGYVNRVTESGVPATRFRVWRFWSDGAIDFNYIRTMSSDSCQIVDQCSFTPVVPSSCSADNDHDGEVGFDDLVQLLGEWGDCPDPE